MSSRCLQAAARRPVADSRCEARIGLSRSSRGGGYTYQYNQRGRNVTAALKNRPAIAQERRIVHTATPCFSITPRCAEQNHKKYQNFISRFVISRPPPPARHAHQAPLAHSDPSRTKRPTHRRHPLQAAPQRRAKTSRLSSKTSPLFAQNAPLSDPLPPRATRHAPPHTRFSRSSFPAFTLHLSIYITDYLKVTGEHSGHFLLHRGEGRRGEAFTPISLHLNNLRPKGEAVKAKIEKRRTRPRVRKTPKKTVPPTFWSEAVIVACL